MLRRPQTLILTTILVNLSQAAPNVVLPLMAKDRLGVSPSLLGTYVFVQGLIYIPSALFSGRLSDRLGRRTSLLTGIALIAAGNLAALAAQHSLGLFFLPFFVCGIGAGLSWPAIEAGLIDGQTPRQIKRVLGAFNYSWISANVTGAVMTGALYKVNPNLPILICTGFVIVVAMLISLPGAMEIAPWGVEARFDHEDRVPPAKRRLFVGLGLMGNLVMFFTIGSYRGLLPEYANEPAVQIIGWRYGLLAGSMMLGMMAGNGVLLRWHRWHYSLRWLAGAELAAAALLVAFVMSHRFPVLVLLTALLGLPASLVYYSAIYYGMEQHAQKGKHGGNHESIVGLGVAVGPLLGGWTIALSRALELSFASRANLLLCAGVVAGAAGLQTWMAHRLKAGDCQAPAGDGRPADEAALASSPTSGP